jgi:RNA polymerase sigma-70 factor, ECF subfamily
MASADILRKARVEGWTDEEVVRRVLDGESALYEIIMRRYNQRLYRVARAIVRDDSEAEDVMQEAYVRAYEHLHQFERRSAFSAWLTRIAVHEALRRVRRRIRFDQWDDSKDNGEDFFAEPTGSAPDPEAFASQGEMGRILEEMLMRLPRPYRVVLMLRDVEEMSTAEAAAALEISEENVKVRLHRGRSILRRELVHRVGSSARSAFPFMGERCDRVVRKVLQSLSLEETPNMPIV